jgi:cell division control protein 7
MIPDSLFDLVDKCLVANPRCRLTSEDALMHEFFVPVRDSLSKQRVPRRSSGSDASCSSQGCSFQ